MKLRKLTACALCAMVLLGLAACAGAADSAETEPARSEYMSAIDAYYGAFEDSDFSQLQQAMPPQALDALGLDAGELVNSAGNLSAAYGSNLSITVNEDGSVELSAAQLGDLSDYLRHEYGITAAPENGYLVEHTAVFSGDLSTRSLTEGIVVYQLNGVWYLDILADMSIDSIRALYDN